MSTLADKPHVVFSVILTNNLVDLVGKKDTTILARNGVTATAAQKLKHEKTMWFYHGKPMNGYMFNQLQVTLTKDQFTMVNFSSDGTPIILGDTAVSRLKFGDVSNERFYLVLLLKNKAKFTERISLPLIDTNGIGFIQDKLDELINKTF